MHHLARLHLFTVVGKNKIGLLKVRAEQLQRQRKLVGDKSHAAPNTSTVLKKSAKVIGKWLLSFHFNVF